MVAICESDILRDCVSGERERVGVVEKGRKKREKSVEASGAAKDIRNSGGVLRSGELAGSRVSVKGVDRHLP